jgi:hypothetical protein
LLFGTASCGSAGSEANTRALDAPADNSGECEDPLTYHDDISNTNAWLLISGPVSVADDANLPGYTRIVLPSEAELLEPKESSGGGWAEVRRSSDVAAVLPVETPEEGIEAINGASNPVLLGLVHFVNFDAWGVTTTFDVMPDESLERQLACAEFQRREVASYWSQARDAGFDGSQLEFTVIATEELLDKYVADADADSPDPWDLSDPDNIGAANRAIVLEISPAGSGERANVCYGQGDEPPASCVASDAAGGESITLPIAIDRDLALWFTAGDSLGQEVGERTEIAIPEGDSYVIVKFAEGGEFEVTTRRQEDVPATTLPGEPATSEE